MCINSIIKTKQTVVGPNPLIGNKSTEKWLNDKQQKKIKCPKWHFVHHNSHLSYGWTPNASNYCQARALPHGHLIKPKCVEANVQWNFFNSLLQCVQHFKTNWCSALQYHQHSYTIMYSFHAWKVTTCSSPTHKTAPGLCANVNIYPL